MGIVQVTITSNVTSNFQLANQYKRSLKITYGKNSLWNQTSWVQTLAWIPSMTIYEKGLTQPTWLAETYTFPEMIWFQTSPQLAPGNWALGKFCLTRVFNGPVVLGYTVQYEQFMLPIWFMANISFSLRFRNLIIKVSHTGATYLYDCPQ